MTGTMIGVDREVVRMSDGTAVAILYALPPEEFTAARDAAAKQARDDGDRAAAKALKALRRPSVAAWLVNRLAAEQADLLEQLLALGPALAAAQSGGQAEELRALGRQRRELVEAVADAAGTGRPVSSAVREEVVSTLEAALADPSSAEAVRSGRLVRGLSYAGFGGVDLSGAVAAAPADRPKAAEPRATGKRSKQDRAEQERAVRREAVVAAEQAAQEAAGRLDDAVRAAERAERQAADRTAGARAAEENVAEARATLEGAERAHAVAVEAVHTAVQAARAAVDIVREAQDEAERARAELDRLRREP